MDPEPDLELPMVPWDSDYTCWGPDCLEAMVVSDPSSTPSSPGSTGDPLRALSVKYLCSEFMGLICETLSWSSTIQEIEEHIVQKYARDAICPRDGRPGCAWVDMVDDEYAGPATHMLSYTWGYSLEDICDSLSNYCKRSELDPETTYVWICAFCINQFRVREKRAAGLDVPFEDFASQFSHRVQSIGHVLTMMEPWHAPKNLNRAWCVYELFEAIDTPNCKLDVVMPSRTEQSFVSTFLHSDGDTGGMWDALSAVCLQEASATVPLDKERILHAVDKSVGIETLNLRVRTKLQSWFVEVAQSEGLKLLAHQTLQEGVEGCSNVARMLLALERYDLAAELCQKCLLKLEAARAEETMVAAKVMTVLGRAYCLNGHYAEAREYLDRARFVHQMLGTYQTAAATELLEWRGMMHFTFGHADRAAKCLTKSLQFRESSCTTTTREGMTLLLELAMVHLCQDRCADAVQLVKEIQETHLCSKGGVGPLSAQSSMVMALAQVRQGDKLGAKESCSAGHEMFVELGLTVSVRRSRLLAVEAIVHAHCGEYAEALTCCSRARNMHQQVCSLTTPSAADIWLSEAYVKNCMGDVRGARECLEQARVVRENIEEEGKSEGDSPLKPGGGFLFDFTKELGSLKSCSEFSGYADILTGEALRLAE